MAGLKFSKLDLHTHTPASKCYLNKNHSADEIILAALDQDLSGIAVTDHNTAEWIDQMKKAAEDTELVIFPGVELTLDQCHLVALFDPSKNQKHVENLLGAVGIKADEYGKSETVSSKRINDVITEIHEHGGLAILAHIDQIKGIFHDNIKIREKGKINVPNPLAKILNETPYDAVECVEGKLPEGFDEIHNIKVVPAYYQASDNPDPEKPTKHSKDGLASLYSWFKLDEINLEGLRQCFADPEMRILMGDDYEVIGHNKIISMKIGNSGFLRSQNFEFHDGLNSIIGGKGVGKSLAIEFLRYGLDQESPDGSLSEDHLRKLEKRLMENNSVEVIYQTAGGSQFKITRKFLGKERTDQGEQSRSETKCLELPDEIPYEGDLATIFPVLAYSQTEVIKIAENKEAQLLLIDQFIDTRKHGQEISSIRDELAEKDHLLAEAIQAKDRLDACNHELKTLRAQIKTINKSLEDPLFDKMREAEGKQQGFDGQLEFANSLIELLKGWQTTLLGVSPDDLSEDLIKDIDLKSVQSKLEDRRTKILAMLKKFVPELNTTKEEIQTIVSTWKPEFDQIEEKYKKLLAEIGDDRESVEKDRKRLEEQKAEINKEAGKYRAIKKGLKKLIETREELLNKLEKAYRDYFDVRNDKFDQLTELSEGKLQLELIHADDRSVYSSKLDNLLKGGNNAPRVSERRKIAANISPRRFVQLVLDRNEVHIASEAEIAELWAGRVIEKLWSQDDLAQVLALQHNCYPSDVPAIRFKKEGGEYGELNELSVGQKCTALLIIALSDGKMPVIIDQPEDALDIISVWEDISKKLRLGKNARQFILTTHNSSVAVASDTDQFIVLKAGANYGKIVYTGAIDRENVRRAVIDHLEGGDEPYKLRAKKYNIQG
jgi:hypothetical protein